MKPISDRRMVELLVFPKLYIDLMREAYVASHPGDMPIILNLVNTAAEILRLAGPDQSSRVEKRLQRVLWAVRSFTTKHDMRDQFLVISYALKAHLDKGDLVLAAGSYFDQAYEAIAEQVFSTPIEDQRHTFAEAWAAKVCATLRAHGYFR